MVVSVTLMRYNGEKIGSWILRHGQAAKIKIECNCSIYRMGFQGFSSTINPAHTTTAKYHTYTPLWKCFHPSFSPLLLIRWGASQVHFVICNEQIWLANHRKRGEATEAPKIEGFIYVFLRFGSPIYLKGVQPLRKHMGWRWGAMENMLGNTLRTWGKFWEFNGNVLGT